MIKDKEQKKVFTTLDAYTAGYLFLNKFTPELIQQGSKVVFCFDATDELYQSITEYNSGARVEAVRFSLAIKNLKSQIFSMRRNKERWQEDRQQKR